MSSSEGARARTRFRGPLRAFLAINFQSSLGNEMAYVALLLIVYAQSKSGWAITALLLVECVPGLLLANAAGALVDRSSRRQLAVAADLARALAYVGLAFSPSLATTLLLAAVANVARTVFLPANRSAIPSLADQGDIGPAMGALWFLQRLAMASGPLIAAAILLVSSPSAVLLVNAATFLASAFVLARLPLDSNPADATSLAAAPASATSTSAALADAARLGAAPHDTEPVVTSRPDAAPHDDPESSPRGALATFRLLSRYHPAPAVVVVGTGATLAFAMVNVGEPLLVRSDLGGGESTFALLVAIFGIGATIGAALARTRLDLLFASFAGSVLVVGLTAVVPNVTLAAVAFAASGLFSGLFAASEDRLVSTLVPQHEQGRVYGLKDSLESAAFLLAYPVAGAAAALGGARLVFVVSAAAAAAIGLASLRFARQPAPVT